MYLPASPSRKNRFPPEFRGGEIPIARGWGGGKGIVGGELVVEIYHDIYRVSKTSIKWWLLRISERSTVRIFDDAPNNKNLR